MFDIAGLLGLAGILAVIGGFLYKLMTEADTQWFQNSGRSSIFVRKREFFSSGERRIYEALAAAAASNGCAVFAKVSPEHFLHIAPQVRGAKGFREKMQAQVDFLICKAADYSPVFGVVISSADEAREQQALIDLFEQAGIPLFSVSASVVPDVGEISAYLKECLQSEVQ